MVVERRAHAPLRDHRQVRVAGAPGQVEQGVGQLAADADLAGRDVVRRQTHQHRDQARGVVDVLCELARTAVGRPDLGRRVGRVGLDGERVRHLQLQLHVAPRAVVGERLDEGEAPGGEALGLLVREEPSGGLGGEPVVPGRRERAPRRLEQHRELEGDLGRSVAPAAHQSRGHGAGERRAAGRPAASRRARSGRGRGRSGRPASPCGRGTSAPRRSGPARARARDDRAPPRRPPRRPRSRARRSPSRNRRPARPPRRAAGGRRRGARRACAGSCCAPTPARRARGPTALPASAKPCSPGGDGAAAAQVAQQVHHEQRVPLRLLVDEAEEALRQGIAREFERHVLGHGVEPERRQADLPAVPRACRSSLSARNGCFACASAEGRYAATRSTRRRGSRAPT